MEEVNPSHGKKFRSHAETEACHRAVKHPRRFFDNSTESESSENDSDIELFIEIEKRKSDIKTLNYMSNVVSRYAEIDFKLHFKLSRTAVEKLLVELCIDSVSVKGRPRIPAIDSLLLTIWVLSNQESFRSVADRFGLNRGHAHTVFVKMCISIARKADYYIKWPTGQDAIRTVLQFSNFQNPSLPNVFGCVDTTHIAIPGPTDDNSYYNSKGYHSLLLQGICNSRMEFIDIFCGWPGSVNEAMMWHNSPIYLKLNEDHQNMLPLGCFLLGDSAYPLREFLMVPFRDNGHLCAKQKKFNSILSSTRVVIEQAFVRLKGIFRRLEYLNITNLQYAKYIILSSCILHNVILQEDSEALDRADENADEDIKDEDDSEDAKEDLAAEHLRNEIVNVLN